MAEIARGTNTNEKANADMEEDSLAKSIANWAGSIVIQFELFIPVFTIVSYIIFVRLCCV